MYLWKGLVNYWRALSINRKFISVFGLLLALMLFTTAINYGTLALVQRRAEESILNSTRIQGLVLEMDRGLQEARVLERDFFLRYPTEGLAAARENYALAAVKTLSQVVELSVALKQQLATVDVTNGNLAERDVNLNLYLSAAERFSATFLEAVDLTTQLADEETGLQTQLVRSSDALGDLLRETEAKELTAQYREMRLLEKDYMAFRKRSVMQSALNVAFQLHRAIEDTTALPAEVQTKALAHLDNYTTLAEAIIELDLAIGEKLTDFDLQAQAVDPISMQLIDFAQGEVAAARTRITRANRIAIGILFGAAGAVLVLAILAARLFNVSVTQNIVKLTEIVERWQIEDLEPLAPVDAADEVGVLAKTFNQMITRLKTSMTTLAERNEQLQREIGERIRAEAERASLATIVENSADFIAMATPDEQVIYINPAGLKMTGYMAEELPNLTIADLQPHLPSNALEIAATEHIWMGEAEFVTKEGSVFPVSQIITALKDADGDIQKFSTIARDISTQKAAKAEREKLHQQVVDAQQQVIRELSTPIIPITDRIIVMPLIGIVDTLRARDITRSLLAGISAHRAKVVILDITGVPVVDSAIAAHLNKTIQAARLKGARVIVTGISNEVAETIVDLGIDWSNVETLRDLQTGLLAALPR